jgi:DNA polymerase-3 subunit delta'
LCSDQLTDRVANQQALRYNSGMSWEVYGHDHAIRLLKEHTKPEKLSHAYLFTGPQGIGKRTLALEFIKALNCLHPDAPGVPCGKCTPCQQIGRMAYADLSVVAPTEGHKDIRIEQVRELLRTINLAPFQSQYRAALFLDFQKITTGASNALLKTLEEPPPKAVLILTADASESLLPTIVSRCEVVRLRPLPVDKAETYLVEQKGLAPVDAKLLAHVTSGRLGATMRLYEDPQALKLRAQLLDDIADLLPASRRTRFAYVDTQMKRGRSGRDNMFEMISLWLTFWRDVGICVSGAEMPLVNIDKEALIRTTAGKVKLSQVQKIMASLEEGLKSLDVYVNSRLLAENLVLLWPRL